RRPRSPSSPEVTLEKVDRPVLLHLSPAELHHLLPFMAGEERPCRDVVAAEELARCRAQDRRGVHAHDEHETSDGANGEMHLPIDEDLETAMFGLVAGLAERLSADGTDTEAGLERQVSTASTGVLAFAHECTNVSY